jgi:hypothetical protein
MTGGGAATNSGIDFQQRVGALAMVAMLVDVVDLSMFGLGDAGEVPDEVRFETADGIDDVVIVSASTHTYVQAKTTLDLSSSTSSTLSSVMRQFVVQFLRSSGADERYVIAMSPLASGRISKDLRKLCEAARLNETSSSTNPLTKQETEVREAITGLFKHHFNALQGRPPTGEELDELLKRIHVCVLDVAKGGTTEHQAITALASQARVDPKLVWHTLVATGLSLARDRQSVDQQGLQKLVGRFLRSRDAVMPTRADPVTETVVNGNLATGREVLLVEDDEGRIILTDVKRFDDDGRRRARFADGYVEMGTDIRWKVIRRTSTYSGMERAIEVENLIPAGSEVFAAPSNYEEDLGASAPAVAHAQLCEQMARDNTSLLECLQCGRPISEESAYIIEVDEERAPHQVGLVHRACHRPTHRVVGTISNELFAANRALSDFDYAVWIRQLQSGQGLFNSMASALRQRVTRVAWNPDNAQPPTGNWGIAYELDDGRIRYVRARGRVVQIPRSKAIEMATGLRSTIAEAMSKGDPFCANEEAFAPYSVLASSTGHPNPPKVLTAEARELTRSTVLAHNTVENYYAPLFYLVSRASGDMVTLGDAAVLLTDPLRLGDMVANWASGGFPLDAYLTVILETDSDFDTFVLRAHDKSLQVVVDPVLDMRGSPVAGVMIQSIRDVVSGP